MKFNTDTKDNLKLAEGAICHALRLWSGGYSASETLKCVSEAQEHLERAAARLRAHTGD